MPRQNFWEGWGFNDTIILNLKGENKNLVDFHKEFKRIFPTEQIEKKSNNSVSVWVYDAQIPKVKKLGKFFDLKVNYENGGRTDVSIAKIILQQLGGTGKLAVMTGAHNFVALPNGVSFKIKNRKVNYIKITLNGNDLYDMQFGRIAVGKLKVTAEHKDIYFDQLIPIFEKETGMYLRLFRKGGIVCNENKNMVLSQLKSLHHHEQELLDVLKTSGEIESWVLAKVQRATTDLSDVTHYLDGKKQYAKGGGVGGKDLFSMSKTIIENGKIVEMVIAENVSVKEFNKLFTDKGYRKVNDTSLVGFYFVKPNGDTIQLIPSFHKKGEVVKYENGGGVQPFEFETKGNTIFINGTKADVKKMYLDYVNNFLTLRAFAEHYNISDKQALLIIENGRKYAETDGYFDNGGAISGYYNIYVNDDWENRVYSTKNILLAKKWVLGRWKKYNSIDVIDDKGDSIHIDNTDTMDDINWLFADENKFGNGGSVGENKYRVLSNFYKPYKSDKFVTYYYVVDQNNKTINKHTGKTYRGNEMLNYKFNTKEQAEFFIENIESIKSKNNVFLSGGSTNIPQGMSIADANPYIAGAKAIQGIAPHSVSALDQRIARKLNPDPNRPVFFRFGGNVGDIVNFKDINGNNRTGTITEEVSEGNYAVSTIFGQALVNEDNFVSFGTKESPKRKKFMGLFANGGKVGDTYEHKHSRGWGEIITIELVEPTNKGWKVKQTTSKGRSTKTKQAFFSNAEISELFQKR